MHLIFLKVAWDTEISMWMKECHIQSLFAVLKFSNCEIKFFFIR